MTEVFKSEANIKVIAPGDGNLIEFSDGPAPAYALDTVCGIDLFQEGAYSPAGAYFRSQAYQDFKSAVFGYPQPITAIVVDEIEDKIGCSLGPLTSYLIIEEGAFSADPQRPDGDSRPSTLAHEFGHQCGLRDRDGAGQLYNLMYRGRERRLNLTNWQKAVVRDSRFVTFL
jgi:hypothetical protein